MKITSELNLTEFKFWSGARVFAEQLTYTELKTLEDMFEGMFEEMTETELNDLFWFEESFLCELIGLDVDDYDSRQ